MKTSKLIAALLWFFIIAPIWYYLCYKVLVMVHATELMMFLFWVYVPVAIISGIITKFVQDDEQSKDITKIEKKVSRFQEKLDEAISKRV